MASQAPQSARAAAAHAVGISVDDVTLIPTFAGGSFGRNLDFRQIARQAAALAKHSDRPVQVIWSRPEEFMRDFVRPPAHARMTASLAAGGGVVTGLSVRIAVPPFAREQMRRISGDGAVEAMEKTAGEHDPMAIAGAIPPYAIPNLSIAHYPIKLPLPGGILRGGGHGYTAFFIESFIDELAHESGVERSSFRMQMLVGQTRLARCLTGVAALANWDGGASGSSKGIACHSMQGSHIALIATATTSETEVKVERISAMVDCGRLINPGWRGSRLKAKFRFRPRTGARLFDHYESGMPTARRLRDIDLPVLSDIPEIEIEFVRSDAEPGGARARLACQQSLQRLPMRAILRRGRALARIAVAVEGIVMQRPADHPEIPPRRIGVILVNLGTPDAPTPAAVRGYLKQFLSDRRVVEISPLIWQPILRWIILNTRPKKSAANYAKGLDRPGFAACGRDGGIRRCPPKTLWRCCLFQCRDALCAIRPLQANWKRPRPPAATES